jgi:hypothetical protein
MAYIPRTMILASYLTTDEGNWMGRSALFAQALLKGDPYGTYQSGHPGVTTLVGSVHCDTPVGISLS